MSILLASVLRPISVSCRCSCCWPYFWRMPSQGALATKIVHSQQHSSTSHGTIIGVDNTSARLSLLQLFELSRASELLAVTSWHRLTRSFASPHVATPLEERGNFLPVNTSFSGRPAHARDPPSSQLPPRLARATSLPTGSFHQSILPCFSRSPLVFLRAFIPLLILFHSPILLTSLLRCFLFKN